MNQMQLDVLIFICFYDLQQPPRVDSGIICQFRVETRAKHVALPDRDNVSTVFSQGITPTFSPEPSQHLHLAAVPRMRLPGWLRRGTEIRIRRVAMGGREKPRYDGSPDKYGTETGWRPLSGVVFQLV